MYKNILIPVAPGHQSESAHAVAVARSLLGPGGTISTLSVLEEPPSYVDAYLPTDQMDKNLTEVTGQMRAEFKGQGIKVYVVSGHSANSILEWAGAHGVDCIVVQSHRPGLSDYLIGSTAARLVRHAQCSVHVLR